VRARNEHTHAPEWAQLLMDAVKIPGTISTAYTRFWNYSVGNQFLALFECVRRGIPVGPIHTFRGWRELGRYVKKGEKAITLCMPVLVKRKSLPNLSQSEDVTTPVSDDKPERVTVFTYQARWFVLSQTDGAPYVAIEVPEWSEDHALKALKIERIDFAHLNGNCQGFAKLRQVAVSPVAVLPHVTLFHELAHVVLGHTLEGALEDHDRTPVNEREVEAECVSLICCESLNLPGVPECRGYIQHWLGKTTSNSSPISDQSARRIFRAADSILKGGRPPTEKENTE
jgi:antirestriction protein ArdC